ncbi:hypothetical protein AAG570_008952 [Ranatra chinensis]|uniref:Uncharacterized protein n=1 Tax=Ranatra chinensis TaxID=642074 RepID=A0ABD0YSC4_9HEMI
MGNRASYGFRECDAPTAVYVSEKGLKKMAEGRGDQTDDEVAAMRLLNRGPYGVISRQEDAQLDRMRELDRQHTARSGICKVAFDGLADRITAAIGAARVEPALPEKDTVRLSAQPKI